MRRGCTALPLTGETERTPGLPSGKEKQKGSEPTLPGVKISVLVSELDPDLIYESSRQFRDEWRSANVAYDVLEGHNHFSPQLGLSTGVEKEEAWGVQVAEFIKSGATT